jgi:hypothetical protein
VEACIANIGAQGQRMRRRFGWLMLVAGVGASIYMIAVGTPAPWRWSVFLPFLLGATGVFQARART